jgi:hypothetical protein
MTAALCACNIQTTGQSAGEDQNPADSQVSESAPETSAEDDGTDDLGDTFEGETKAPAEGQDLKKTEKSEPAKSDSAKTNEVDLIMFMGEYNMSGEGGDASLAPKVPKDNGMEFRAISDPTKLYPIGEPFGANENNDKGLNEFPGVKKGSLVSSFVNDYHTHTGRKVIAVSASMSLADMDVWTSEGVMTDVKQRLESAISFLKDNNYKIGHIYALWLHGESDGLKGSAADSYKKSLETVMNPLFKAGLEKVFIITPGRTIDYKDIYGTVIDTEIALCKENKNYALATTVLSAVSTEYMVDQYHYNQHVLNYVGEEAAKSVAYFTVNNAEKIVYDFRNEEYVVPKGVTKNSQKQEKLVNPSEIDINKLY